MRTASRFEHTHTNGPRLTTLLAPWASQASIEQRGSFDLHQALALMPCFHSTRLLGLGARRTTDKRREKGQV